MNEKIAMSSRITKLEGAQRQLDTAIDLYFDNADSLSIHTLAWAAFKVVFDVYPHHSTDGFSAQIDEMLKKEGWKAMSMVANFLKHADKDPNAFLTRHHPGQAGAVIGLATLLYRRATGDMTPKMMGFDAWTELLAAEALGIDEVDENEERAREFKEQTDAIARLPYDQQIKFGKQHYTFFIANYEAIKGELAGAKSAGMTVTDVLDSMQGRAAVGD